MRKASEGSDNGEIMSNNPRAEMGIRSEIMISKMGIKLEDKKGKEFNAPGERRIR